MIPCLGETCKLIVKEDQNSLFTFSDFYWVFIDIIAFTIRQIEDLFPKATGNVGNLVNTINVSKGRVPPNILEALYNNFIAYCLLACNRRNHTNNDFRMDGKIPSVLVKQINRMLKFCIHIEREKWLMDEHTMVFPIDTLHAIQEQNKGSFWDSFNAPEKDQEKRNGCDKSDTKQEHYTRPTMGLTDMKVSNNSSHKTTYMDPAIDTHQLGYIKWAHFNQIPCSPYAVGYSADVIQKYYDRKVNYVDKDNNLATCDMTSMLRMTQTLIRGFDKFIGAVSNSPEWNPSKGKTRSRIQPMVQTTRSPYQNHGFSYPLDGSSGVYQKVLNPYAGRRQITSDDLMVFGNVLFTVVNIPGIFNLLNSSSGDAMNTAKQQKQRELLSSSSEPLHYTPMTANVGFVNSGKEVPDGPTETTEDLQTWIGISKMTHTKLRVGIMDQPAIHNTSRWYLDEVLNNTRPTNSTTALHAWSSFMYQIYQKQGFACLFRGHQYRMLKHREENAKFKKDYPVQDTDQLSIQDIIEEDAEKLVNNLIMCCKDAGLQDTDPRQKHFAFASLNKQNIDLPHKTSHKLFYILFGETICKLADDLENMPPLAANIPQNLQQRSNQMLARHLRVQAPRFLKRITGLFFSWDLHKNLVGQLQRNKHQSIPNKVLRDGTWDFEKNSKNIMEATSKLRNIRGNPIKAKRWN